LRDLGEIADSYRGIAAVLKPGGVFLDYDLFGLIGGTDAQMQTIRDAGFVTVDCLWKQERLAIICAIRPGAPG
jgi:hypothetical protein